MPDPPRTGRGAAVAGGPSPSWCLQRDFWERRAWSRGGGCGARCSGFSSRPRLSPRRPPALPICMVAVPQLFGEGRKRAETGARSNGNCWLMDRPPLLYSAGINSLPAAKGGDALPHPGSKQPKKPPTLPAPLPSPTPIATWPLNPPHASNKPGCADLRSEGFSDPAPPGGTRSPPKPL